MAKVCKAGKVYSEREGRCVPVEARYPRISKLGYSPGGYVEELGEVMKPWVEFISDDKYVIEDVDRIEFSPSIQGMVAVIAAPQGDGIDIDLPSDVSMRVIRDEKLAVIYGRGESRLRRR